MTDERSLITDAFTELAPIYSETVDSELRQYWGFGYQQFVEYIVSSAGLQPNESVLDIATGMAAIPLKIRARNGGGNRVVGVDITPAMLTQGRELVRQTDHGENVQAGIQLVCGSGMQLPFADHVFDVVICGLGTHHMDVPLLLAEIRRVLVDRGRIILADVGATRFWRSLAGKIVLRVLLMNYGLVQGSARARAEIEAFKNVRTADEWKTLLSGTGFREIEIREIPSRRPWYPCGLNLIALN